VLLAFTVPALKWPHYGLGCAPALALLVVRDDPPRWACRAQAAVLALVAIGAVAALRWPLPAAAIAALVGTAVASAIAAVLVSRARIAPAAAFAGAGVALVLAIAIPAVNPPVIPPAQLAKLEGRELYVYGYVPGIFTLGAGRTVRRAEEDGIREALERGGVVIFAAPDLSRIPGPLRDRIGAVARWEHVAGSVSPATVLRAWRERTTKPLFEPMLAVELLAATSSAQR
jgi:hypothetical protein